MKFSHIWFHGVSIQYGSDMIRMGATKFEEQLQITQISGLRII